MLVSRADGMYVYDAEGEEYLDFSSQLVNTNIGHSHPKVVSEIQKQAEKLATTARRLVAVKRLATRDLRRKSRLVDPEY